MPSVATVPACRWGRAVTITWRGGAVVTAHHAKLRQPAETAGGRVATPHRAAAGGSGSITLPVSTPTHTTATYAPTAAVPARVIAVSRSAGAATSNVVGTTHTAIRTVSGFYIRAAQQVTRVRTCEQTRPS